MTKRNGVEERGEAQSESFFFFLSRPAPLWNNTFFMNSHPRDWSVLPNRHLVFQAPRLRPSTISDSPLSLFSSSLFLTPLSCSLLPKTLGSPWTDLSTSFLFLSLPPEPAPSPSLTVLGHTTPAISHHLSTTPCPKTPFRKKKKSRARFVTTSRKERSITEEVWVVFPIPNLYFQSTPLLFLWTFASNIGQSCPATSIQDHSFWSPYL